MATSSLKGFSWYLFTRGWVGNKKKKVSSRTSCHSTWTSHPTCSILELAESSHLWLLELHRACVDGKQGKGFHISTFASFCQFKHLNYRLRGYPEHSGTRQKPHVLLVKAPSEIKLQTNSTLLHLQQSVEWKSLGNLAWICILSFGELLSPLLCKAWKKKLNWNCRTEKKSNS